MRLAGQWIGWTIEVDPRMAKGLSEDRYADAATACQTPPRGVQQHGAGGGAGGVQCPCSVC